MTFIVLFKILVVAVVVADIIIAYRLKSKNWQHFTKMNIKNEERKRNKNKIKIN